MHEKRDKKYIDQELELVQKDVIEGEGGEGLQELEKVNLLAKHLVYDFHQVLAGEGPSFEDSTEELASTVRLLSEHIKRAAEGEDAREKFASTMQILKDVDDRLVEGIGDEFAPLSERTAEEILNSVDGNLDAHVKENSAIDSDVQDRYYIDTGDQMIETWSDFVVANAANNAEPNLNDLIREARQARLEKVKKFASNAGAVALGSLPVIGAMLYLDRKNKHQ